MTNHNKTILILLACLAFLFTACYTHIATDTKYFKGTAKVTRFGLKYIQNSGLIDTVYNGKIKLKETGKDTKVYYFKSVFKSYEKTRYYVIEFSDENHNQIQPGVLFDVGKNCLILCRYSTQVIVNSKTEDGKMTKNVILDVIITWLNRERYSQ